MGRSDRTVSNLEIRQLNRWPAQRNEWLQRCPRGHSKNLPSKDPPYATPPFFLRTSLRKIRAAIRKIYRMFQLVDKIFLIMQDASWAKRPKKKWGVVMLVPWPELPTYEYDVLPIRPIWWSSGNAPNGKEEYGWQLWRIGAVEQEMSGIFQSRFQLDLPISYLRSSAKCSIRIPSSDNYPVIR